MLRVLQAGRGLAAAGVAAFHLSVTMGVDRYGGVPVFTEFTRQGFRGVDFFFVLSGFIIFFAHFKDLGHPAAWKEYAYRRFVRVFPIYWLYTAGLVVLLLLGFGTEAKNPQGFADWLTSWTLIRFTDAAPPIGPAWTLFHEVAFYAMFSLLIFNLRLGIIALALWACVCAAFWQFPMPDDRTPFNVYTAGYNLFFLFGMGAFWLYRRGGRGFYEFAAGIVVTVAAAITLDLPYKLSYLALVLGFALLVAGATKMSLPVTSRCRISSTSSATPRTPSTSLTSRSRGYCSRSRWRPASIARRVPTRPICSCWRGPLRSVASSTR